MAKSPESSGNSNNENADSEDVSRFDENWMVHPEFEQEYESRLFDEEGNLRLLEPYEGYDEEMRRAYDAEAERLAQFLGEDGEFDFGDQLYVEPFDGYLDFMKRYIEEMRRESTADSAQHTADSPPDDSSETHPPHPGA